MEQEKKAFCEECSTYTGYSLLQHEKNEVIRGLQISYLEKQAFCNVCRSEMWVHELEDQNIAAVQSALRIADDIISVEEIQEVLQKYNIRKRPLSQLLGWGDITVTRYLDGVVPSKKYSDLLKEILINPHKMSQILETNKENIKEVAYKKCRLALDALLLEDTKKLGRIYKVANYIINKNKYTDPLMLQKLLYYSQGIYYLFKREFLLEEDCQAWPHGPVFYNIYSKYKDNGWKPIEDALEVTDLSTDETEILDLVIKYFGCYGGRILENMTHEEMPWKVTRKGLEPEDFSKKLIEKDLIGEFFNEIKDDYDIQNFEDIRKYSTEMFNRIQNL